MFRHNTHSLILLLSIDSRVEIVRKINKCIFGLVLLHTQNSSIKNLKVKHRKNAKHDYIETDAITNTAEYMTDNIVYPKYKNISKKTSLNYSNA